MLHPGCRYEERLRQAGVGVRQTVLEPRPIGALGTPEGLQEPERQRLPDRLHVAVTLERAEVLVDSEQRKRPRAWAGECRDRGQRRVKQIATETLFAGIAGPADHGAQCP